MKVLCIGSSNIEITCPLDSSIVEDSVIKLSEKYECGGGNAGNIAYLFGKWGVETYIASMVGADDLASKIKKEYETIGVRTDFIETSYDKGTSQSIVIINKVNKSKTVLDIPNNSFLKKYAFNIEPDLIISDGNDHNASLAAFDKYPKIPSFLTITNVSNEVLELGKYVQYIILNRGAAETITNGKVNYDDSNTIVNIYNSLKQRFSKAEIIMTLGERGCVYSINGQVKIMPALKVEVVDTNGAGSVFVGAFAYAMGRSFGLEKSIAYATIASSLSTTKITGRMSIPTLTEVSNYYDGKFGTQNNPNNQVAQVNNASEVNMQTNMNTNVSDVKISTTSVEQPVDSLNANNDLQINASIDNSMAFNSENTNMQVPDSDNNVDAQNA
mgnify:CR=1 FL=1